MSSYKLKIILLGEAAVGKTSLIYRFAKNRFAANYKLTVGVDILTKDVEFREGEIATVSIFDIGGQQRFDFIRSTFYKGQAGGLVIFDLTRERTFTEAIKWLDETRRFSERTPFVLIGNKSDLLEDVGIVIDPKLVKEFAEIEEIRYVETSAKTGRNVEGAFSELIREIISGRDSAQRKKVDKERERNRKEWEQKYNGMKERERKERERKRKEWEQKYNGMKERERKKRERKEKLRKSLEHQYNELSRSQKRDLLLKYNDQIIQKVERILCSPPYDDDFRFLIAGNEETQKPFLLQLLNIEGIEWPPNALTILYNSSNFRMPIGKKKYNFEILFLSNLKKLNENHQQFLTACENSDGIIIFYDPSDPEDFKIATDTCITLRSIFNPKEYEIILTAGTKDNLTSYNELERLRKNYNINYFDDIESILTEIIYRIVRKRKRIKKKKISAFENARDKLRSQTVEKEYENEILNQMVNKDQESFQELLRFAARNH